MVGAHKVEPNNPSCIGIAWGRKTPWVVMVIRLVFISCFLAVPSVVTEGTGVAFYALIGVGYLATIPYSLWMRHPVRMERLMPLQFLVDLCWVTGVVYFTGGAQSSLALLYPVVIVSAGLVSGPRRALQMSLLSSLIYVTMVLLMAHDILLPYGPGMDLAEPRVAAFNLAFSLLVFACIGAASAFMTMRSAKTFRTLDLVHDWAGQLFNELAVPLVVLEKNGDIGRVNQCALDMLDQTDREILGQPFQSLLAADSSWAPGDSAPSNRSCVLRKGDGTLFTASFESAPLNPSLTRSRAHPEGGDGAYLLVFHDISGVLHTHREAHRSDRRRTVENLVHILADGIRNPVAAISGSSQVLHKLENVGLNDEASREERARICELIVRESARLDQVVERFVEGACFNPEGLDAVLKDLKRQTHQEPVLPGLEQER